MATANTDYDFVKLDPEDVEDWLESIEHSFQIRFSGNELKGITHLSQLTEHIIQKLNLENVQDCTNQQAFYKLRKAIAKMTSVNVREINPDTKMEALFPDKKIRRKQIQTLKQELGLRMHLLAPPVKIQLGFGIAMLLSIIGFFFNWALALPVLLVLILLFAIINETTKHFSIKTMRELTTSMVREHYRSSRRNPNSMNREEIEELLRDWYRDYFGVE